MIRLGVNIDHVATLRQVRGTVYPSVVEAAGVCEQAGAHGITIHLRMDERHIQRSDVYVLRECITTKLNLEMANTPEMVAVALEVKPDEVCLVPERREELTTEGGLDVVAYFAELKPTVAKLREGGMDVSMFIDPEPQQVAASADLGANYIELHTGTYADNSGAVRAAELERLLAAADQAHGLGLKVNAGHSLALDNVEPILALPWLDTLNIGHSIVSRAVFVGLEAAVREMLAKLQTGVKN